MIDLIAQQTYTRCSAKKLMYDKKDQYAISFLTRLRLSVVIPR